jgi:hypothetical protein
MRMRGHRAAARHVVAVVVAIALGLATGSCGSAPAARGGPPSGSATPAADGSAGATPNVDPNRPSFSAYAFSPVVSLFTLHYAIPTAIHALPSGDVILAGCTEGPTDLLPEAEQLADQLVSIQRLEVLMFVARVDPREGVIRWVRHFGIKTGGFTNGCVTRLPIGNRGAEKMGRIHTAVGGDGSVHVAALVTGTGPWQRPVPGATLSDPVVLSLDLADGASRWVHSVGGPVVYWSNPASPFVVAHLVAAESGVDAVVLRAADDGLDEYALLHLDAAGRGAMQPLFRAVAMPGRSTPCHTGAGGCSVDVRYVARAEDGSLVLYGTFRGVELSLGATSIRSSPDGVSSHGFWAAVERDGTPRWLRWDPDVLSTIVRVRGHDVLATVHLPSYLKRVEQIAIESGARRPWNGAGPAWPIAQALRLYEKYRGRLGNATIGRDYGSGVDHHPIAPPPMAATLTPELLGHLADLSADAPHPKLADLPNGSLAAILDLHGTLSVAGATTTSSFRFVECHPGPAGKERPMPENCRERRGRSSAVLIFWP